MAFIEGLLCPGHSAEYFACIITDFILTATLCIRYQLPSPFKWRNWALERWTTLSQGHVDANHGNWCFLRTHRVQRLLNFFHELFHRTVILTTPQKGGAVITRRGTTGICTQVSCHQRLACNRWTLCFQSSPQKFCKYSSFEPWDYVPEGGSWWTCDPMSVWDVVVET